MLRLALYILSIRSEFSGSLQHQPDQAYHLWSDRWYHSRTCNPSGICDLILGDLFVGALRGIAPLLVFFLVMSSLFHMGKGQKTNMKFVVYFIFWEIYSQHWQL